MALSAAAGPRAAAARNTAGAVIPPTIAEPAASRAAIRTLSPAAPQLLNLQASPPPTVPAALRTAAPSVAAGPRVVAVPPTGGAATRRIIAAPAASLAALLARLQAHRLHPRREFLPRMDPAVLRTAALFAAPGLKARAAPCTASAVPMMLIAAQVASPALALALRSHRLLAPRRLQ